MLQSPQKKVRVKSNEDEKEKMTSDLIGTPSLSDAEDITRTREENDGDNCNQTCKRTLFTVAVEDDGDEEKLKKQNLPTLQLSPNRARDEIKDLRRQVSMLTKSCNARENEMQILQIKMKGFMPRREFDCPNALDLLPFLEGCRAFQEGCGPETPIVLLLNRATVRVAYGNDTHKNFCLSITFEAVEYPDEEENEDDDDDEESEFTSSLSRKRNRQPEPQTHRLRVRYECGNKVMLTERGEENMRYIHMGQSCKNFVETKDSYMKCDSVVAKFAGYAGIPQKALLVIFAMGVNLLPKKCKDFCIRHFSNPESMLKFTSCIANSEPHYLLL